MTTDETVATVPGSIKLWFKMYFPIRVVPVWSKEMAANNVAYVGTDTGKLYKIKDVFACIPNALVLNTCNGTNANGPSLDTTFGSNGSVQVGATDNILTGPIFSPATGINGIVVGGSDGKVYLVSAAGAVVRSVTVGNGSPSVWAMKKRLDCSAWTQTRGASMSRRVKAMCIPALLPPVCLRLRHKYQTRISRGTTIHHRHRRT